MINIILIHEIIIQTSGNFTIPDLRVNIRTEKYGQTHNGQSLRFGGQKIGDSSEQKLF